MDGLGALVFFPGGSGYVASNNGFNWEDLLFVDVHGAVAEGGGQGGGN